MMTVKEAEALVADARERLKNAEAALRAATIEASPVKLGQEWSRSRSRGYGSKRKEIIEQGVVTGFVTRWGRTLPVMTLRIADGSLGKRQIEIEPAWGNWEMVKDAPSHVT